MQRSVTAGAEGISKEEGCLSHACNGVAAAWELHGSSNASAAPTDGGAAAEDVLRGMRSSSEAYEVYELLGGIFGRLTRAQSGHTKGTSGRHS